MQVTCSICKKKIDRDEAYKRVVGGKNIYYCSEDEYNTDCVSKAKIKAEKDAVYDELIKIFGYNIQNSALWKEWAVWNTLKPNEIIAAYLIEKEDYLKQAIGRLDTSEYARIRYVSAVIKNGIVDFVYQIKEEPIRKMVDMTMYDTSGVSINKRRSLSDLEDEVDG